MEFLKLIVIVIVLLALAVFGLAIQIIFKKSHKFPNIHISRNKKMKENGITCAQSWDKSEQIKANSNSN